MIDKIKQLIESMEPVNIEMALCTASALDLDAYPVLFTTIISNLNNWFLSNKKHPLDNLIVFGNAFVFQDLLNTSNWIDEVDQRCSDFCNDVILIAKNF